MYNTYIYAENHHWQLFAILPSVLNVAENAYENIQRSTVQTSHCIRSYRVYSRLKRVNDSPAHIYVHIVNLIKVVCHIFMQAIQSMLDYE